LAESLGDQQLDVLENDASLSLVREFILLVQSTGARHLGALLEAADAQTDLAEVLTNLSAEVMGQTDLPDPQSEWEDALRRIELDSLKKAQANLISNGLTDPQEIARYQELSRRISGLIGH